MNTLTTDLIDENTSHASPVPAVTAKADAGSTAPVSHEEETLNFPTSINIFAPGTEAEPPPVVNDDLLLTLIDNRPTTRSHRIVYLHTPRGKMETHYYPVKGGAKAVLFTGGIGPKQDSPASNCYPQIADELQHRRLAGLRVKYRPDSDTSGITYDMRIGIRFLLAEGFREFALIGPSVGTESVLQTALLEPAVTAVGLWSVGKTTSPIEKLGPRCRLLIIHGGRDLVVNGAAAKALHERASEPKEFLLLPRSTNSLNENSIDVHMRTREWLFNWLRS